MTSGTIELMVARELDSVELTVDGLDWVLTVLWERIDDQDLTYATWRRKHETEARHASPIDPAKVKDALEHPSLYFRARDHSPEVRA